MSRRMQHRTSLQQTKRRQSRPNLRQPSLSPPKRHKPNPRRPSCPRARRPRPSHRRPSPPSAPLHRSRRRRPRSWRPTPGSLIQRPALLHRLVQRRRPLRTDVELSRPKIVPGRCVRPIPRRGHRPQVPKPHEQGDLSIAAPGLPPRAPMQSGQERLVPAKHGPATLAPTVHRGFPVESRGLLRPRPRRRLVARPCRGRVNRFRHRPDLPSRAPESRFHRLLAWVVAVHPLLPAGLVPADQPVDRGPDPVVDLVAQVARPMLDFRLQAALPAAAAVALVAPELAPVAPAVLSSAGSRGGVAIAKSCSRWTRRATRRRTRPSPRG